MISVSIQSCVTTLLTFRAALHYIVSSDRVELVEILIEAFAINLSSGSFHLLPYSGRELHSLEHWEAVRGSQREKEAAALCHVKVWRERQQRYYVNKSPKVPVIAGHCSKLIQLSRQVANGCVRGKKGRDLGKLWFPSAPIIAQASLLFPQITGLPICTMLLRLPFPHWSSHLRMNSRFPFYHHLYCNYKIVSVALENRG